MTNKIYYEANLPDDIYLFHQPFWLNAVSGDNWDVALIIENDKIIASMPYCYNKTKAGLNILMPLFSSFLGPYIVYKKDLKNVSKINQEMNLLDQLMQRLPPFKSFNQNWHNSYQNWLPFYWNGYKQTTRYTYIIEDRDIGAVWDALRTEARTEIRRGEKMFQLTENRTNRDFYDLVCKTWERQKKKPPADFDFHDRLINVLKKNNAGRVLFAEYDNKPISALLYAWDSNSAYALIDGTDAESKYNGAQSFVFWNAIKFASESGRKFNLNGSMLFTIEKFLRKFGGTQKTYFAVTKNNKTINELIADAADSLKMAFRLMGSKIKRKLR